MSEQSKKMKFRKKPVVIDAWQLNLADDRSVMSIYERVHNVELSSMYGTALPTIRAEIERNGGLIIPTLEGNMLASDGDWIIQGVNGEFYPCKPDIFEKTYEAVDEIS